MGLTVAATVAFCAWIVLWAIGWKPMDAFLVTLLIITLGATARMLNPFLPGRHEPDA
jgi:hypothetical protein